MFRIRQFAELAHVTVKTLHHYDRLGLLVPAGRSEAGYRLYRMEDLAQLERILVLRYLGLPLREIGELLAGSDAARGGAEPEHTLPETLARQAKVLRERRKGIDRVIRAVELAQQQLSGEGQSGGNTDWSLYQIILKEIHMQETQDWSRKYYSDEAQAEIEQRREVWSPELQAKVTADWQAIYAEVQGAIDRGVAPQSDEGKALAARWMKLVEAFTGGSPQVLSGLNKLYADRDSWPAEQQRPEFQRNLPRPELMAFVRAAQA